MKSNLKFRANSLVFLILSLSATYINTGNHNYSRSSSSTSSTSKNQFVKYSFNSQTQENSITHQASNQDAVNTETDPLANDIKENLIGKLLNQAKMDWDHTMVRSDLYMIHNGKIGKQRYSFPFLSGMSTTEDFIKNDEVIERPVFKTSSLNSSFKAKVVMDKVQINFGKREDDYDQMDMSELNLWDETPAITFTGRLAISTGSGYYDYHLGIDTNDKSKSSSILPKGYIKLSPNWGWKHFDEVISQETGGINVEYSANTGDAFVVDNLLSQTEIVDCHCPNGRRYDVGRQEGKSGDLTTEERNYLCQGGLAEKTITQPSHQPITEETYRNRVQCGNKDTSGKVNEEFNNLRPYLNYGRFECRVNAGEDNPKLVMSFTTLGQISGSDNVDLEMPLDGNCLIKNYKNNGVRDEQTDPRTQCMKSFDNMYIGCVKGAMPEVLRNREMQVWHPEGTKDDEKHFHEYAQKTKETDEDFDRWHPFFGYRKDVNDFISLILINPIWKKTKSTLYEKFDEQFNDTTAENKVVNRIDIMKNSKIIDRESKKQNVFFSCTCPSGGIFDINPGPGVTECYEGIGQQLCDGGVHRCINYNGGVSSNEGYEYSVRGYPLSQVRCNRKLGYNYNKLEVEDLYVQYGFGVIKNILCVNQKNEQDDKKCEQHETIGFGSQNMMAILLTDSIESMDVNNRIMLVSDLRYPQLGVKNKMLIDTNWSGENGGICICQNFEKYPVGGKNHHDDSACINGEFRKFESLEQDEKSGLTVEERDKKGIICRDVNYQISSECKFNIGDQECGEIEGGILSYCKHSKPYCSGQNKDSNTGTCVNNDPGVSLRTKYGARGMPTSCVAIHETLNTEVPEFHIALNNEYKVNFQKNFYENQKRQNAVSQEDHKISITTYNTQIETYKTAVEKMKNSKSIQEYQLAYKDWEEVKKYFEKEGCGPAVPPPPPKTLEKPKIEDECHKAYKLGWKIGKDIALLVTESGETYGELQKQMKCVKEYIAVEHSKKGELAQIKQMCLDKGRKEASRLIWGLSRNPVKLKQYLKSAKSFDHWKLTYKVGYEEYLKDLMNVEGAKYDNVDLINGHNGLNFKGKGIKNEEFIDRSGQVNFEENNFRICHCRNGDSYPITVIKNNGTEKGCAANDNDLTNRDKRYCNGARVDLPARCYNKNEQNIRGFDQDQVFKGVGYKCGS